MSNYLSKSDFKVGRTCPTKVFYKKNKYPNTLDDDAFMEMLADGGFMVGKFAQLKFPEGINIEALDVSKAVAQTKDFMQRDSVTLFEAAFLTDGLLARVDVLVKKGNELQLIEVKSKSFDPAKGIMGARGGILSEWTEYIEDVAFQRHVIERAHPGLTPRCFLMVPNKAIVCEIELLPTWFSISRRGRAVDVQFHGAEEQVRASNLLSLVDVDAAVSQVWREVVDAAAQMAPFVVPEIKKAPPVLSFDCQGCEYRMRPAAAKNGFNECWGALAKVEPSLLELYQFGRTRTARRTRLADELIATGKVSLYDIPEAALTSAYGERQKIQIRQTRANAEWRSPHLRPALEALAYPLHFIDFETTRQVFPYHRGMKPFEQVAFQWSCHSIDKPGADLRHQEWINLEPRLPNVEFAQTLRTAIGDQGTVFTWSPHEETTLRDIARQIVEYGLPDEGLRSWLEQFINSGRLFDLCEHTKQHYFHPAMKGSNSIKAVLPAVWQSNPALRQDPWFSDYARESDGEVLDPYATLPSLEIYNEAEVVNEGTGAMHAYHEMVYGVGHRDLSSKQSWRDLLLQYCKLDTLAMVIIWKHWTAY
ncbi:MAG: DUF2779 domain-containing protein [Verrucomicrobiota bacterium]